MFVLLRLRVRDIRRPTPVLPPAARADPHGVPPAFPPPPAPPQFIYVEQAFFQRWWAEQDAKMQTLVKGLVAVRVLSCCPVLS
jgi:hypothetical protein